MKSFTHGLRKRNRAAYRPLSESRRLEEKILYIATTLGVPLKITGAGEGMATDAAAVDSELALLYGKLKGAKFRTSGLYPTLSFAKALSVFRILNSPFIWSLAWPDTVLRMSRR